LIVSVAGEHVPTWESMQMAVLTKANRELALVVRRGDQNLELRVTPDAVGRYDMGDLGVAPVLRPQVIQVTPGPAERAGFQAGDVLLAVDGARGLSREEIIERIRQSGGRSVAFTVERDGAEQALSATPEGPDGAALIGVSLSGSEVRHINPSIVEAMGMSLEQNWDNTVLIGQTLRGLFTRETPMAQLMGPVAIADMSGTAASMGWVAVFNLMAMISLNLGLLNLMPVPVLDGGHIAILAVEGLARRDISMRVKERILMAGAALIMLLMVTVIYNDIARLLR
jgi:regulator of sigma E protease